MKVAGKSYLDYIFSCYLHTVGFYPYLLSYIYIYIYIYWLIHKKIRNCIPIEIFFSLFQAHHFEICMINYGISKNKVGGRSRGWPEGSLFDSYNIEVYGRALLLFLGCSTLPLKRTLYCWVLSKEVSSTIFKIFGMTRPEIELRSPGPLANTMESIF